MKYKVWGKAAVALKPAKHHYTTISVVLFILALFVTFIVVIRMGMLYAGSIYSGIREPYIQSLGSKNVVIRWQSDERVKGKVVLLKRSDDSEISFSETTAKESHAVNLQGLDAGTRYYYRLYHDQHIFREGPDYWFETAPESGASNPVRIWILGNPGASPEKSQLVQKGMLDWVKENPRSNHSILNMIISTGNNTHGNGSNNKYQQDLFSVQENLFKNFVFWPVYGEVDAKGWSFFNIFSLPENAEAGGLASGTERYYSVDYGPLHLIFLDSDEGGYTPEDAMLRWLKKDLKNTNQKWIITFMHHPPYTRGSHNSNDARDSGNRMFNMRKRVLPILEEAGVDMVIAGHSYSYERSSLIDCHYGITSDFQQSTVIQKGPQFNKPAGKVPHQGTVYAVLGSSSMSMPGQFDHPAMVRSSMQPGSMILDIEDEKLAAYFINDKAKIVDQFEINKSQSVPVRKRQCQ